MFRPSRHPSGFLRQIAGLERAGGAEPGHAGCEDRSGVRANAPRRPVLRETLSRGRRGDRSRFPRVLGDVGAGSAGPLLVCVGGLHGNEPCGVLALERVFARLHEDASALCGRLIGLTGNRQALEAEQRFLDDDLNRIWKRSVMQRAGDADAPSIREVAELREIAAELEVLYRTERGRGFLLDVHSTSGGGAAFTSLDDTLANRALAFEIPVPHVLGLEEELEGTLVSHLNGLGIPAIGFESGQHLDPASVDRAEAAIWITMEAAGVLERGARAEVAFSRELLREQYEAFPRVVEVLHRHPVEPRDGFAMLPDFENFQAIEKGQPLARDGSGPIDAPLRGMILMPLYQGQGEDGFFVVRNVHYVWLKVSGVLRKLRADRILHWLPGVRREPRRRETFRVDLRRARLLALPIFHLLGYKRIGQDAESLVMRRRDASPD